MGYGSKAMVPKCGEIWMCDIPATVGSVQQGIRPVFITSNDLNNKFSPTVNYYPLTSKIKNDLPVHVRLTNYTEYGLSTESTILVEQPNTVPKDRLLRRLGEINDKQVLDRIRTAIIIQCPMLQ